MEAAVRNRLLLAAAGLLFSTGGAAVKAASLTGWQVASFRSGLAAAVLLAVIPGARRQFRWSMLPVAAAYAATLILFVLANRLTTSANAIFLQATAPLYLLLLGPLLLREPIRRNDVYYMLAVAFGLALFLAGRDTAAATAPDPPRGNVLALASGVTYALMLAGLRWQARHGHEDSGIATAIAGNAIAFTVALPMALPVTRFMAADVAVILYLGVAQVGLAYWCLTRAIRHVPAFEATTMLQIEPAMNPIWSWLAHGERPTAWALAGGAVIVCATVVNTWLGRRGEPVLQRSQG
ncbi:MAG: DMT family transporter [Candidatus Solibacter sp.]